MRDRDLYTRILGLQKPWIVTEVKLDNEAERVEVGVVVQSKEALRCPHCDLECPGYDHRTRRWRHLDTCQYQTILEAEVPRIECPKHGVLQVSVPWAEPGSQFTSLFEAIAIDWLSEASVLAVARRLGLTWDEVDGIMQRAVRRGLARRKAGIVGRIGVDETSFQKRHEYVTVVTDIKRSVVLYVADKHSKTSLEGFYKGLSQQQLGGIELVAMDMWEPYISATKKHVPGAEKKIAFDKFHVAQYLSKAVDKVRRQEHRILMKRGDDTLKGTKYLWLQNPDNMKEETWEKLLKKLKETVLKTARAWAIKENAMCLWHYVRKGWARKAWKRWIGWALRSRLEPIKEAARTVKNHLEGILNAIVLFVTNAAAESMNAKIQRVKRMACGFRSRQRFRNAIYFHLGGLDLYPTHTKS